MAKNYTATVQDGIVYVENGYLVKDELKKAGFRAVVKAGKFLGWEGPFSPRLLAIGGVNWPSLDKGTEKAGKAASVAGNAFAGVTMDSCRIPADKISKNQKDIETFFLNEQGNIVVEALAGSGKTTLLRHLSSFQPTNSRFLYLVFNRKNSIEASEKFPKSVDIYTSHSFLGRILSHNAKAGKIEDTELWAEKGTSRITSVMDKLFSQREIFPNVCKYLCQNMVKQIAELSKNNAIDPRNESQAIEKMQNLLGEYGFKNRFADKVIKPQWEEMMPLIIESAMEVLHFSIPGNSLDYRFDGKRDHDDTLWFPTLFNLDFPKYQVILADEIQDFNACQISMVSKLMANGGRVIAVGDANQAMYSFRGAANDAFKLMAESIHGTTFTLPHNYRSGKKIMEFVKEKTKINILPGLDFDGEVKENVGDSSQTVTTLSQEMKENNNFLKNETCFISRVNAILAKTAVSLLYNDIDFVLLGRDLSKEFIELIEQVTGTGRKANHYSLKSGEFQQKLAEFIEKENKRFGNLQARQAYLETLRDNSEALSHIIGFLQSKDFQDCNMQVFNSQYLIQYLQKKFGGVNPDSEYEMKEVAAKNPLSFITLTSAHRSKGMEYERVYILAPEKFPSKNAKTATELQQEMNMYYVALTRAKRMLNVCSPEPKEVR